MILQDIILNVRKYLDDDASSSAGALQRWSNTELTFYINQSYTHYYNILISRNVRTVAVTASLDLTANSRYVTLPTDFYKMVKLERVETSNNRIVPLSYIVNYDGIQDTSGQGSEGFYPDYEFEGDASGNARIKLSASPDFSEIGGLLVTYYKLVTKLVTELTDEPIGILKDQFVELIILDAAKKAKGGREEEDVTNIIQMLAVVEENFNEFLSNQTNARQYIEPFYTGGY